MNTVVTEGDVCHYNIDTDNNSTMKVKTAEDHNSSNVDFLRIFNNFIYSRSTNCRAVTGQISNNNMTDRQYSRGNRPDSQVNERRGINSKETDRLRESAQVKAAWASTPQQVEGAIDQVLSTIHMGERTRAMCRMLAVAEQLAAGNPNVATEPSGIGWMAQVHHSTQ
jgi:hypothetical protein